MPEKKIVPCYGEDDPKCSKPKYTDSAAKRVEDDKTTKELQLADATVKFIAFFIFAIISFFVCLVSLSNVMESYLTYAKKSRFPGPVALFIGVLLTTVIIAYVCYRVTIGNPRRANIIFWLFIIFNVTLMVWFLNLAVRADSFAHGSGYDGRGSFYMLTTFIMGLGILYLAWEYRMGMGILALLAMIWITFLVFIWIFDGTIFTAPIA